MSKPSTTHITRAQMRTLAKLSPFELKDFLITAAKENAAGNPALFLNAGRGNPNWIATTPREAFFSLGQFAVEEAKRPMNLLDLGGMPQKDGIAARFDTWLERNKTGPGVKLLREAVDYGVKKLGFNADAFIYELTDSTIGDQYPVPDRMLGHAEQVVHAYLVKEMCGGKAPRGKFQLFAVEGGTAAMCYIFNTLKANRLLKKGDKIAIGVPIFTPYLEIAGLEDFDLEVVQIKANDVPNVDPEAGQYPAEEIAKLEDKRIKAFFVVNPSNPPSFAIQSQTLRQIAKLVKTKRPDLIVLTDDVYGTFVSGFRSLLAELPYNTIGVYSFSKYFGCTGWRLGVIATHEKNILDGQIAGLPAKEKAALRRRYGSLTLEPDKMKFIDRLVADSRCVALNHTAGLSLPQQVMMTLFSLFGLIDEQDTYKATCHEIVHRRLHALYRGLGFPIPTNASYSAYYIMFDLMLWAKLRHGEDFCRFLAKNYDPFDLIFRIAEKHGVVLMDGGGFGGPKWSFRISLANLADETYEKIGDFLVDCAQDYLGAWEKSKPTKQQTNGK
ncbi:MAG: bifunctional aspartate transaminase/aspartate 4-decarboxylase [Verrucomicrobiota bacterium]